MRRAGVALDEAAPEQVSRLQAQLGKSQETDLAVVFTLGKLAEQSALEALVELEKECTDKELKKEIRRGLFKLGQRGFTVARPDRAAAKTAAPLLQQTSDIEAYLSAVDGAGVRLVWIARPQPGHGLQVFQAMVHDRDGLLRIGGAQVRRKEFKKMTQEIKDQHEISMFLVPWEYADAIIYQGFEKAKALGRAGLENFHELRSVVNVGKPKDQVHPIYQRLDPTEVREGAWRELSRRLLDEPELRFWFLDDDWVGPYLGQLEEAQTSRLVLNPAQKQARFGAIVRDAVKALCGGEMGAIWQRRMEDMALCFLETGRSEPAKLALAVALQVKEADPGPLDISFLTGLVQKSFAFYLSQQKAKAEEAQPSLIIKP